ncbi:MAG: DUF134 domain-containing protein [Eubacteriales bacterium]|nr:DUF134 domain-containing protein [Eubacteriales bacterium]
MARPVKWRKIEMIPQILKFNPDQSNVDAESAVPKIILENILKLEELEAIRLKDLEGYEQEECAAHMEVSRPTFQRILISARKKVADSLIKGKSIRIDGGYYTKNICQIRCQNCGREWIERYEAIDVGQVKHHTCPRCRSALLRCCPDDESELAEECRRKCESHHMS